MSNEIGPFASAGIVLLYGPDVLDRLVEAADGTQSAPIATALADDESTADYAIAVSQVVSGHYYADLPTGADLDAHGYVARLYAARDAEPTLPDLAQPLEQQVLGTSDAELRLLAGQTSLQATIAATDPLPVNSPASAGEILETVRGDDHTTASPHGAYVWNAPASVWGDLTGATITFTSRRDSDDVAEIDGYAAGFTVVNPNTEDQQVQLELPAAQTALLTPSPAAGPKFTNKFDVEVTRGDEVTFTLARGRPPFSGHTIHEDQTRAS